MNREVFTDPNARRHFFIVKPCYNLVLLLNQWFELTFYVYVETHSVVYETIYF